MGIRTRGYHPAIYAMRESMLLRQELREQEWNRMEKIQRNKQLRRSYWLQRMGNALANLKSLDPDGWESWFDGDALPEKATFREYTLVIEARVRELLGDRPAIRAVARLYRGVFIWHDGSGCFVFGEDRRIYEFADEAEARGHIDATLAMCGQLLGALA